MVDRLVEKKMLVRERSVSDRRVVVVRLSEEAIDQIDALERAMLENFITMIDRIGPELTHKWCSVISQINDVLEGEKT